MENSLSWDDTKIPNEEISEGDLEKAEAMGKLPPMRFLGRCRSSHPKEAKLANYTCYAANLKWEIRDLISIEGKTPTDEQKNMYEGRFVFDDVMLPHPDEKDGMRNRRLLIAKRCGLINSSAKAIPAEAWRTGIIDKEAIITTERQTYTDKKTGDEKTNVKVAFSGYESATGADNAPFDGGKPTALPDDI